ncbi:hypothetical protein CYY_002144 [Polysphondylium violaceum]|uniref:Transmembrane protein n=1 Tax=Polysphondylium violaceum TaxID=133409 RepID=A0A8J4V106_9MYCE|nr:hypothetical protein CYY_002144 [Polysphondylium violaceum]
MSRGGRLGAALLFNALFVSCCIISFTTWWYRIQIKSSISTDTTYFSWTFSRFENGLTPGKIVESNYKDYNWDTIANVCASSLGLLTVSCAFGLLSFLLQVITLGTKNKGTKISGGIFLILAGLLMLASFFQYIRIGNGFQDDLPECKVLNLPNIIPTNSPSSSTTGSTTSPWYYDSDDYLNSPDHLDRKEVTADNIEITSGFEKLYCQSFNGHNDKLVAGTNIRWGPFVGWYILVPGFVFAVVSSLCTFLA